MASHHAWLSGPLTRPRPRAEGREVPSDYGLAVPGKTNPGIGREGKSVRGARTEPRPDGARSGARGRRKAKTFAVPHAGGGVHDPDEILKAIVEAIRCGTCEMRRRHGEPGGTVPAHGPHAAHLVPGMRNRHYSKLLRPRPGRLEDRSQERWSWSAGSAAPGAWPAT